MPNAKGNQVFLGNVLGLVFNLVSVSLICFGLYFPLYLKFRSFLSFFRFLVLGSPSMLNTIYIINAPQKGLFAFSNATKLHFQKYPRYT